MLKIYQNNLLTSKVEMDSRKPRKTETLLTLGQISASVVMGVDLLTREVFRHDTMTI